MSYINEKDIKLHDNNEKIINIINSNYCEIINCNIDYLFCYNIKSIDLFNSSINVLLVNDDCNISFHNFNGNIKKYNIKNNNIKKENTFSFIF